MKKKGWIIGLLIAVLTVVFACLACMITSFITMEDSSFPSVGPADSVAVIRIEGVIASSQQGGLLPAASVTPENIIVQIREANKDSRVGAIVLRVDSPGGSAAASQEIYREVRRSKKPVVVSVADIGASGAYYIASGAKEIYASPSSLVGSIGVILSIPNFEELYKKLGVDFVTIKQGQYKDIGSPDRPMTEEEKQLLAAEIEITYEQFIKDVADGRRMDEEKVREIANGMAWTGSTAKEMGLVDELGNYQDAIMRAGKLGKIEGEPNVITYEKATLWELFTEPLTKSFISEWRALFGAISRQSFPAESQIQK